jgi:hypothetical protein
VSEFADFDRLYRILGLRNWIVAAPLYENGRNGTSESHFSEINANMKSNQEKAEANSKADQVSLARMESQIGSLVSRMEADRKSSEKK